jgi:predicted MFS family arabinose efflux permease
MQPQPLKSSVVLLFAIACGLAVGNVYYAQPLLDAMADAFAMSPASIGIVMTLTQIGYGIGLVLLVPLGDLLNRRRLIVTQTLLSAVALLMIALAPNSLWLLLGMTLTGLLAVVTQVLVAYAATLAIPAQRGRVVGVVTSGIVVGILLARTVAGAMADLAGWRAIYLLSAGLTLLMALLLLRVLPRHESAQPSSAYGALIVSVFRLFKQEPVLRQRAILALLTFASAMVLWTPMVLPLAAPPLSLSHSEIGLFGLAGAAGALAAARAGHLADRGLGQWVSGVSLLLMLASWLPIAHPVLVVGAVAGGDHSGSGLAGRTRHQPEHDLQRAPRSAKPPHCRLHAVLLDWQRRGLNPFHGDIRVGRLERCVPARRRYQCAGAGLLVADPEKWRAAAVRHTGRLIALATAQHAVEHLVAAHPTVEQRRRQV